MENCWDFLEWLGPDTSSYVLMRLDDLADLLRVSSVSHSWRRSVIANGLCKKLCLRMCLELSTFNPIVVVRNSVGTSEVGSSTDMEWETLEREHRVYAYLGQCLASPMEKGDVILESISASSTDNYPDETIENTLEPCDLVDTTPSYWSSVGRSDSGVPEMLTYRLKSKLCIVNEIKIRPFKAFFQHGDPIYSAKSVRFRMGYSTLPQEARRDNTSQESTDDNYIWTYVSPDFPMLQESVLQSFKLPRPVICTGGIVQIELVGRVQTQEMDGLYYICVCHVEVIGSPLSPVLDAEIKGTAGCPILKYFPECQARVSLRGEDDDGVRDSGWHALAVRIRRFRRSTWNHVILTTFLRIEPAGGNDDESSSV